MQKVENEVRTGTCPKILDRVEFLVVEPPKFVLLHGHGLATRGELRTGFGVHNKVVPVPDGAVLVDVDMRDDFCACAQIGHPHAACLSFKFTRDVQDQTSRVLERLPGRQIDGPEDVVVVPSLDAAVDPQLDPTVYRWVPPKLAGACLQSSKR